MILSIFSSAFWPSVCLPWRNVYFCPFFDWIVCFFDTELHELFVYFRAIPFLVMVTRSSPSSMPQERVQAALGSPACMFSLSQGLELPNRRNSPLPRSPHSPPPLLQLPTSFPCSPEVQMPGRQEGAESSASSSSHNPAAVSRQWGNGKCLFSPFWRWSPGFYCSLFNPQRWKRFSTIDTHPHT